MWTKTKNRAGSAALPALALMLLAVLAVTGCAANKKAERAAEASQPAVINDIRVTSSGGETTVLEIVSSKSAPFTSFQLADPPRVVLDIRGKAGENLEASKRVYDPNVTRILVEEGPAQALTTRVVAELARSVTFKVAQKDAVLAVVLTAEKAPPAAPAAVSKQEAPAREAETAPAEPKDDRIFFEPRPTGFNEVLGLDFKMLDRGNSVLSIHTDKKARYDLRRKGSMDLVLTLDKVSIRPLLLRHLDSTHFEGAIDKVFSKYSPENGRLALIITLREMVPYHLNQSDGVLTMDFSATRVKPPDMKIVPMKVAETRTVKQAPAETSPEAAPEKAKVLPMAGSAPTPSQGVSKHRAAGVEGKWDEKKIPGTVKSRYTGQPMTMDFVNAEVPNILRLIGEVSDLNIIWSPEVKGTVSMRLKKVPWDQALELVLANNDLGMRREGNVIWITTRAHLKRIEMEEKKKRQEERQQQIKLREDTQKAKEAEPLETAYMPLDFADAKKIMAHIVKSKRGTLKVDERTNTIIMEDTPTAIAKAKTLVDRFDTPVKQIMIEARIVDASTGLARDLGVQWNNFERQWKYREGLEWFEQGDTVNVADNVGDVPNDTTMGGGFSSNSPENWAANVGLQLARLTNGGLGALAIDVSLALAETENKAKVISAPKVIASNGEKALIKRGDTFYLPAAENVEPKEVKATLSLEVTPTVSYNNFVNMEITLKDEKKSGESGKTGKDLATKLMVKSGDTIVIGGIYTESTSENVGGIPFLKDIPFVGWAFKAETKGLEKTELLIFITPTVLTEPDRGGS